MRYKCDVIRDLMPLCVDDAATEASKNVVVEHIAECKECELYYNKVINEIPVNSKQSEESKGYVKIAKTLRRRKLITRTIISVVVFVAFELLFNYATGYRFTAESAASLSGRLNASSELIGNYDWGDWEFYIYNSANSYDVVTVNKHWNGWKAQDNYLVWPKYISDKGGIINAGNLYYWTDTNGKYGIQIFPIIAEDAEVARIEITVFNQTKTMEVETNKLKILAFENKKASLGNEVSGYAFDSAGNKLYKLVENDESMRLVWQKLNN